ncbi:hypothetical protein ACQP00_37435 [Dactylosporangium sp. CS-047395]|uniref:hypothetical protein n=1 Tax=Dactylosporangium sp. CS-047395 TaxID=3239936 RepID=UPI003D8B3E5F
MDQVLTELLASLAGGAGGKLGELAWSSLSELVRRFRHADSDNLDAKRRQAVERAEEQITALERAPGDGSAAVDLGTTLAQWSTVDDDFRIEFEAWVRHAQTVIVNDDSVHNAVSGGTQHNVVQARDIGNISFGS